MVFETAWDDVHGAQLDPDGVRKVRLEEVAYYRDMEAVEIVPVAQAWSRDTNAHIDVRCIDHNLGDSSRPLLRSRLVAKDFNTGPDDELYAGTPPLEALKLIVSHAATGSKSRGITTDDLSRAYLHGPCRSELYVRRCDEDLQHHHGNPDIDGQPRGATCWQLRKSMYGTRLAAQY